MSALSEYVIPYLGLANGTYEYFFELDNSFFANFEKSEVDKGNFDVNITFEKQDRMVVLMIQGEGYTMADCDRCLSEIEIPIVFDDRVILKIEDAPAVQEDEVYYLDTQTSHIDLSPYINESIHLYLPMKKIRDCESEDYKYCDQEVLKNLDNGTEEENKSQGDNPWDALRKLNLE